MRLAVLSDLHANLEALDAVLERLGSERVDSTYVLGDIVGYGADPDAVVERVTSIPDVVLISGNHDLAACGRFDTEWFNDKARAAIEWTSRTMDPSALDRLAALEPVLDTAEGLCVHGSVAEPATEYVVKDADARKSFEAGNFTRCFFGHTHLPTMFVREPDGRVHGSVLRDGREVSIDGDARVMLNPGSVGQPRDGDPRASFMVVDTGTARAVVHRVEYDVARAQRKIRAAGLPDPLADRLARGR